MFLGKTWGKKNMGKWDLMGFYLIILAYVFGLCKGISPKNKALYCKLPPFYKGHQFLCRNKHGSAGSIWGHFDGLIERSHCNRSFRGAPSRKFFFDLPDMWR